MVAGARLGLGIWDLVFGGVTLHLAYCQPLAQDQVIRPLNASWLTPTTPYINSIIGLHGRGTGIFDRSGPKLHKCMQCIRLLLQGASGCSVKSNLEAG